VENLNSCKLIKVIAQKSFFIEIFRFKMVIFIKSDENEKVFGFYEFGVLNK